MSEFKDLNIADAFTLRYQKTSGGCFQQTYTEEEFEAMQDHIDDAVPSRNEVIEEVAQEIEKFTFAFGVDTVSSFAAFVRGMKE